MVLPLDPNTFEHLFQCPKILSLMNPKVSNTPKNLTRMVFPLEPNIFTPFPVS